MPRETYVKPYRRKNPKSKGKHRVSGHTRNLNSKTVENPVEKNYELNTPDRRRMEHIKKSLSQSDTSLVEPHLFKYEHDNGMVFRQLNIGKMRQKFEEEYL